MCPCGVVGIQDWSQQSLSHLLDGATLGRLLRIHFVDSVEGREKRSHASNVLGFSTAILCLVVSLPPLPCSRRRQHQVPPLPPATATPPPAPNPTPTATATAAAVSATVKTKSTHPKRKMTAMQKQLCHNAISLKLSHVGY